MPTATAMLCTSWLASTSLPSTSQVLRILPRSGRMAWNSLSRACFAEPPAESPSTRNSSARIGSCPAQSASLPGNAGPWVMRLRSTFLLALSRRPALLMASSANCMPSSGWALSQRLKASLTTPETKAAASRDDRRSLVWPENCGSCIFIDRTKAIRSQTSSGASLTPRGNKLRNSQNSRMASSRPWRRPLTWVPPWAVGIRLT
ncbi:hypothetical protein D3C84_793350 [compost metagenome]